MDVTTVAGDNLIRLVSTVELEQLHVQVWESLLGIDMVVRFLTVQRIPEVMSVWCPGKVEVRYEVCVVNLNNMN